MNTITCQSCGTEVPRGEAHIRSVTFRQVGWCAPCWARRTAATSAAAGPDQSDVDTLRGLLDLLDGLCDNDQRARYLLTCNWMRDRGAAAARRIRTGGTNVPVRQTTVDDRA